MGFLMPKAKTQTVVQKSTPAATEEKKDTAKAKARLLETEGGSNGAEIANKQGASVRRIFG